MKTNIGNQEEILKRKLSESQKKVKSLNAKLGRRDEKIARLKAQVENGVERNSPIINDEPIRNHSYGTFTVTLASLLFLRTSMSMRAIAKTIEIFWEMLGYQMKAPHHTTIHLWIRKMGYSLARKVLPKVPVVVMMDESIEAGKEKLLLVTCVPLDEFQEGRPLKIEDGQPVFMGVQSSWKGEEIASKIGPILSEMNVAYVLSDKGSNIKKAVKELGYRHFFDFTHEVALQLKHTYQKDSEFLNFTTWLGEMRKKLSNSKHSEWCPPKIRHKSRFHDLGAHIKWVEKVLRGVLSEKNQDEELTQKLMGVTDHLPIVRELRQILHVALPILQKVRNQGIDNNSSEQALWELLELRGERPEKFAGKMINFISGALPEAGEFRPYCCTDSLESFFGKFKSRISLQPEKSFTNFTLTASLIFLKKEDEKDIAKRLETVKVVEVRQKNALENLYDTAPKAA